MRNLLDKLNLRWLLTMLVAVLAATGAGFAIGLWLAS